MANGRPGDSRYHDIVHLKIATFGPTCDGLVREIAPRLPRSHLHDFQDLIETWPWEADGSGPRDTDALFQRLLDWRAKVDTLPPDPPPPSEPPPPGAPPPPPPTSTGGRVLRGILGFVIGAVVCAFAAAVLAGMLIPIPSGDAAMGTAIGIVFVIMPLAGLAGGVLGAVLAARR
jgi:hypothetical protein